MRLPSSRLVSQMQNILERSFYGDTANYITRTVSGTNTYNEPVYTETTTAMTCSFTDKATVENWREFDDVQIVDAEIRFSTPVPSKGDAITVTSRFDLSSFTDRRYHIIGIKDRGALGYVCALRAIDL